MLSLTQEERKVVLFLLSVALLGSGADFLVKKFTPHKTIASLTQKIGKVNLNEANKELLMSVSGVGLKLAQRIIEYRQERSRFHELEELKNIKGITDYRFEKIKDSFVVE